MDKLDFHGRLTVVETKVEGMKATIDETAADVKTILSKLSAAKGGITMARAIGAALAGLATLAIGAHAIAQVVTGLHH